MTLTIKELESLRADDDGKRLRDKNGIVGTVRAGKSGALSVYFSLRYKYQGKQKEKRLGTWPKSDLKEIRNNAKEFNALLAKAQDPIEQARIESEAIALETELKKAKNKQLKAELEAMKAGITLAELVDLWIQIDRTTAVKDKGAEVRRSFNKDLLPDLGKVLVKDLTRGRIAVLLDKVKARSPSIARYLLADMRTMFKWAILREYCETDPTHLLELKKYATKNERDRVLSAAEITELANTLPTAQLPVHTEQAVWLMLSTCCRVGEISQAKWSDVNLEAGTWKIPAPNAKNGKPLTVRLSAFAIERFKAIQVEQARQMKAWERHHLPAHVIPSEDWSTHIDVKAISKQVKDRQRETPLKGRAQKVNKALILSSGEQWTPHDLRRTGATLMRSLGIDSDTIEACLNHVKKETLKRIYQRPDLTHEMAQAWAVLGERLDLLKAGHSNVVVLNTGT